MGISDEKVSDWDDYEGRGYRPDVIINGKPYYDKEDPFDAKFMKVDRRRKAPGARENSFEAAPSARGGMRDNSFGTAANVRAGTRENSFESMLRGSAGARRETAPSAQRTPGTAQGRSRYDAISQSGMTRQGTASPQQAVQPGKTAPAGIMSVLFLLFFGYVWTLAGGWAGIGGVVGIVTAFAAKRRYEAWVKENRGNASRYGWVRFACIGLILLSIAFMIASVFILRSFD